MSGPWSEGKEKLEPVSFFETAVVVVNTLYPLIIDSLDVYVRTYYYTKSDMEKIVEGTKTFKWITNFWRSSRERAKKQGRMFQQLGTKARALALGSTGGAGGASASEHVVTRCRLPSD